MKTLFIALSAYTLLFLVGCAEKQYTPPSVHKESNPVIHHYNFHVIDSENAPLASASIEYTLRVPGKADKTGAIVTDQDGNGNIFCKTHSGAVVQPGGSIYYYEKYKSSLTYKISKPYHFMVNAGTNFDCGNESSTDECLKQHEIILHNYVSMDIPQPLREKAENVVSQIMLEAFIRDSLLANESIKLERFKNNSYLKMNFRNLKVYNSLKLNKYDIGKILFDDVVRKILTHLNNKLWDENSFYGYEINLLASSKDFIEKESTAEQIEYKFYLPKVAVKKYKDMDISGQELLDYSIILQNNERVSLRLQ